MEAIRRYCCVKFIPYHLVTTIAANEWNVLSSWKLLFGFEIGTHIHTHTHTATVDWIHLRERCCSIHSIRIVKCPVSEILSGEGNPSFNHTDCVSKSKEKKWQKLAAATPAAAVHWAKYMSIYGDGEIKVSLFFNCVENECFNQIKARNIIMFVYKIRIPFVFFNSPLISWLKRGSMSATTMTTMWMIPHGFQNEEEKNA